MSTQTPTPVYTAGQAVKFEGQPAVVVTASKPKADLMGRMVQSLEISRYEGKMRSLIGSLHSALELA